MSKSPFLSNRSTERLLNRYPTSSHSSSPAQHEYLHGHHSASNVSSDEVFSIDNDEDSALIREDIGPRTIGRRDKTKHAREARNRGQVDRHDSQSDDESERSDQGNPHTPIVQLPHEVLSRILAYLDPVTLHQSAGVCRTFASVAKDDATWRLAFALAYRLETSNNARSTPILRRTDGSSWKAEYMRRSELLRRWRKARSPTVICDPRVSTIHHIALSLPHQFLLSASETFGVASRCDPFSGKVAKGFVDASGQLNGLAMGGQHQFAMEQAGEEISSVCLDSDASRIVWGYQSGEIGMTTLMRQGTNPRGAIKGFRFSSRERHAGAVLDIAMPFGTARGGAHSIERSPEKMRQRQAKLGEVAEIFATAGMDGTVRLWSPKKALPIWVDVAQHAPINVEGRVFKRPDPVVCVEMDIESGTVVAATSEGQVTLWSKIDLEGLIGLPTSAFEDSSAFQLTASLLQAQSDLKRIKQSISRIHLPPLRVIGKEGALAPSTLVLDLDSGDRGDPQSSRARLLVFCSEGSSFERIDILKEPGKDPNFDSTLFITPRHSSITVLRPDFDLSTQRSPLADSALFAERRYVCAGTSDGQVLLWDWDSQQNAQVEALCTLDGHHTTITAIDTTSHAIVLGCSDGTIKAFCPLTGQLIRTFNDRTATRHPARMLAAGELTDEEASRFHVAQIIAGPESLVASIGGQVLAWRAEKLRSKTGRKSAPRSLSGKSSGIGRLWDPKLQSRKEMERDVYETKEQLKQEQAEREAEYERIKYSVGGRTELEVGSLSEQEAFEYAMMLSLDEQHRRHTGTATGSAGGSELQNALEQIAIAESSATSAGLGAGRRSSKHKTESDDQQEQDDSFDIGMASQAESPMMSPISSPALSGLSSPPSRAWDILQQAGPSASPVSRNQDKWHPNNKVSIVQVPRSARLSSSYSSAGASRRPSMHVATPPQLDSPHDWPTFESSSLSRSPGHWQLGPSATSSGPHHLNSISRATPSGPGVSPTLLPLSSSSSSSTPARSPTMARSPMGVWAVGSPSLRPVKDAQSKPTSTAQCPSALSSSKPGAASPLGSTSDELDADLKFALELSLAEEQSRKAQ